MAKLTLSGLGTLVSSYVAASKQAGAWSATTNNIYGAVDKIGKMVMLDSQYIDKLPELDGDDLPFGTTVEEYQISLVLPEAWTSYATDGADTLVPSLPAVENVAYSYTLGRNKIKTTVPYNDVERAALNASDASNMITKILKRLGDSYEMFKFATKKQLLGNCIDKAVAASQSISLAVPTDTETGEAFIKAIKNQVEAASFAHEGGLNGALIGAAPELTLYIKKGVMSSIEVDTLAGAFNTDKLAMPCKIKVVDDFGTITNTRAYALLVDPRGVKLHRHYHVIRDQVNAEGDFINYIDHSEHTGFISKYVFMKAIVNPSSSSN